MEKLAEDIVRDYTTDYAISVATDRALSSLVDGLKPISRRVIDTANDLHLYHNNRFLKVSKLAGAVMGDRSPHGGVSMESLAQPFKTRYPLFEGHGNFGSPDTPNAIAAQRYIECRLTEFCEEFYLESTEYADKDNNYDGRLQEVTQYYPPIPGCLITGATGMAVGISTSVAIHTISDVCKSMLAYLSHSKYFYDLLPETCEKSCIITPKEEIIEYLYKQGKCSVQYKAKTHYESIDKKLALVVDAFPPGYSKKRLQTASILEYVDTGLLELTNESASTIRYVFKSTSKDVLREVEDRLTSTISYQMMIEHQGRVHQYTLKEIYDDFIAAREIYVRRKYSDMYQKVKLKDEFLRVLFEFKKDKSYIKTLFDRETKDVLSYIINTYHTTEDIAKRILSQSISSMLKDYDVSKYEEERKLYSQQMKDYNLWATSPIIKIEQDIRDLYEKYKNEERNAIHIDNTSSKIKINYKGEEILCRPTDMFYRAHTDNTYSQVSATDIIGQDLENDILVSADYHYYILQDELGFTVVNAEKMSQCESKLKSDHLTDIVGTNDLSTITVKCNNSERKIVLNEGWVKSRVSYSKQVDAPDYIEIIKTA